MSDIRTSMSGATRIFGIIGDPVDHSLSPKLQNAAYKMLGFDAAYVAFHVQPGDVQSAISGARALGIGGLSVTMPHKQAAARAAEQTSDAVRLLGVANTIVFRGGVAVAENTDGIGFVDDLVTEMDFNPQGKSCVVIGAGGSARAIVLGLFQAGAKSIAVINRTLANAEKVIGLAPNIGRIGEINDVEAADLVVNTTPVGMGQQSSEDLDVGLSRYAAGLNATQLVVDVIYNPPGTPFLKAAAARGARTRSGLGMLVSQAMFQVELFTGERPEKSVLWAALRS